MMRLLVLEPVQSFTLRFWLRMVTSMALESRSIRRGTRRTWGGCGRAWPWCDADGLFCQSCGRHALLMRGLIFRRWWGGSSSGLRHGLYHYQKRPRASTCSKGHTSKCTYFQKVVTFLHFVTCEASIFCSLTLTTFTYSIEWRSMSVSQMYCKLQLYFQNVSCKIRNVRGFVFRIPT